MGDNWELIKDNIMYNIVKSKFEQNEYLRIKLIRTGEDYLEEENIYHDTEWGTYNGVGQNKLGKILMRVRDELSD